MELEIRSIEPKTGAERANLHYYRKKATIAATIAIERSEAWSEIQPCFDKIRRWAKQNDVPMPVIRRLLGNPERNS